MMDTTENPTFKFMMGGDRAGLRQNLTTLNSIFVCTTKQDTNVIASHAFVEASAHALAVTPTAHWLEYLNKAAPLLEEPADLKDGFVTARGPGLGMRWNEEVVARHLV